MNDQELQKKWRKSSENFGVENVRIALSNQTYMPEIERAYAWSWLKEQDEVRNARTLRYNRWTLFLAFIGAIAAVVAAITGILALK